MIFCAKVSAAESRSYRTRSRAFYAFTQHARMAQQMPGTGNALDGGALVGAGGAGTTQPATPNPAGGGGLALCTALFTIPPQPKTPRTNRQEDGEGRGGEGDEESEYDDYHYVNCKGQSGNYLELQENALKPMFLAACEEVAECEESIAEGPWPPVEEAQVKLKSGAFKNSPGAVAAVNTAFLFVQNMLELKTDCDRLLAGRIVRDVLHSLCEAPQQKLRAEARRDRIMKARISLPKRMAAKRASRIRQECNDAKNAAGCNLVIGKRRK